MASLRDITRRHLMAADPVPMQCVDGEIWIKPKKWSEEADDQIRSFGLAALRGPEGREALNKLRKLEKKYGGEIDPNAEVSEEDLEDLAQVQIVLNESERRALYEAALLAGVGEHNIIDDDGNPVNGGFGLDKKTVQEILDWKDLADEMFKAVQEYNRPLPRTSEPKSGTSPSGSIPESSSTPAPASSQTERTPLN